MQDLAELARDWLDAVWDNPVLYRERGPWRRRGPRVLLAAGAATGAAWMLGVWWRAWARPALPAIRQLEVPYMLFGLVPLVILPLLLAVLAVVALQRDLRAGSWELIQLTAVDARRYVTGHLLRILLRFPAWAFVLPLAPLHALTLKDPVRGLSITQDISWLSAYPAVHTLYFALALASAATIGLWCAAVDRGPYGALGGAFASLLPSHVLINGVWLWVAPFVAWFANPALFLPTEILLVAYHAHLLWASWNSAARRLGTTL